jgi:hypothetical protein
MQEIESFATKQKQDKKTIRELEEKITKIQVIILYIRHFCFLFPLNLKGMSYSLVSSPLEDIMGGLRNLNAAIKLHGYSVGAVGHKKCRLFWADHWRPRI